MVLGLRIDDGERFEAALEEVTIPLSGGDLFMFFTDGLSEQMNHAEDLFGEPRLGMIIEQHGAAALRRAARAYPSRGARVRRTARHSTTT